MRPRNRPRATAGSRSAVQTGATRRSGAASPVGTRDGLFCCSAPRSSSRALARRRHHPGVTRRVETRRRPPRLRPERSCHSRGPAAAMRRGWGARLVPGTPPLELWLTAWREGRARDSAKGESRRRLQRRPRPKRGGSRSRAAAAGELKGGGLDGGQFYCLLDHPHSL